MPPLIVEEHLGSIQDEAGDALGQRKGADKSDALLIFRLFGTL